MSADVGVAASPCLITQVANPATQLPGAFRVGVPANGSECGISWSMRTPPLINRQSIWGYYFYYPPAPAGAKVSPFFVSTDVGGYFQNGPNVVTFAHAIDVFTSEFSAGMPGGLPQQRTFIRRLTAFDSLGRLLIDTIGGDVVTVRRQGMRVVHVFGENTGVDVIAYPVRDTTVVGGAYVLSFRPDSSCPPSGDPVLDTKQIRDAIDSAYVRSGMPPAFKETGGDIFLMDDGSYKAIPRNEPTASACTFPVPLVTPPLPPGATKQWAYYHSHAPENAFVNGCLESKSGTFYSGFIKNESSGGLSPGDWGISSTQGLYVYAYNGSKVSRANIGVPRSSWVKNPNRWKLSSMRCMVP